MDITTGILIIGVIVLYVLVKHSGLKIMHLVAVGVVFLFIAGTSCGVEAKSGVEDGANKGVDVVQKLK